MKKNIIITLSLFAFAISGCEKNYLELTVNPNTPSVATPQFILSGAEKTTADIVSMRVYSVYGMWIGYWAPSGASVPQASLINYNFQNTDYQVWGTLYSNLSNYNYLEVLAGDDPKLAKFKAIAKIMKAFNFQALVDNYNNVPYTTAFKGSANVSPAYDTGGSIYDDLLKQLDAAIALIKSSASATDPGASDIMFGGDMTGWIKFANTIKLRLVIRQWNLTAKHAALSTALNTTSADGYLDETVQAKANPGYENNASDGGKQSPFWKTYGFDVNGNQAAGYQYDARANSYAVQSLTDKNDPRLSRFYLPISGSVKGNAFGGPNPASNSVISPAGAGLLKSPNQDAIILSSAESLFLQSEAAVYGLIPGNAQFLYERAITASFIAVEVPNASSQASTYYAQAGKNNVTWNDSPNKIQAIITQKWIALNGYGNFEAYNEYRRTGYPIDVPRSVAPGASGTTLPSRIFYPSSEYEQNGANVAKEGTIDRFTSKIFWAK